MSDAQAMAPLVLAVDDTPGTLRILASMLMKWGCRVSAVTNGLDAIDSAIQKTPDLIILDIDMPDMSGFELCTRLKEMEALRDAPVIFISALSETGDKVEAFKRGGVDYITKPFQAEEVRARVQTHLRILQQTRELADNFNALRELEKMRDSLVHMIVHDMRSPLTGIASSLQLMQIRLNGRLEEEETRDLETAISSSYILNEMISSMLDISRMENNELPLNMEPAELPHLVDTAISSLSFPPYMAQVKFLRPSESLRIHCDTEITRRIIVNLVANAVKFSPPEEPVLVGIISQGSSVKVSVRDRGPGIPKKYHEKIFRKFGQVEARAENRTCSSGLGLAFCKMAVELQGGSIGVESTEGHGSTFWFTLERAGENQE